MKNSVATFALGTDRRCGMGRGNALDFRGSVTGTAFAAAPSLSSLSSSLLLYCCDKAASAFMLLGSAVLIYLFCRETGLRPALRSSKSAGFLAAV
jgi:hypothetical protein